MAEHDPQPLKPLLERLETVISEGSPSAKKDSAVLIKSILLRLGESNESFASEIGVTPITVSRWIKGKNLPRREQLKGIRQAVKLLAEKAGSFGLASSVIDSRSLLRELKGATFAIFVKALGDFWGHSPQHFASELQNELQMNANLSICFILPNAVSADLGIAKSSNILRWEVNSRWPQSLGKRVHWSFIEQSKFHAFGLNGGLSPIGASFVLIANERLKRLRDNSFQVWFELASSEQRCEFYRLPREAAMTFWASIASSLELSTPSEFSCW